jgi:chemotaxis response regulator CheB
MKKRNSKNRRGMKLVARRRSGGRVEADSVKQASALLSTLPSQSALGGSTNFPIVGIGASAGGLEALTQLLRALPVLKQLARRDAAPYTPEACAPRISK